MSRAEVERLLTEDLQSAIASGREIRRFERGGSINVTLESGGHQAVLVRNKGSNTWLLTGWKLRPVAEKVANDTDQATHQAADSSDGVMGAGAIDKLTGSEGAAQQAPDEESFGQPADGGITVRGAYVPSTAQLHMLAKADASTFAHESAHQFLDMTVRLSFEPDAPVALKKRAEDALAWFGIEPLPGIFCADRAMLVAMPRPFNQRSQLNILHADKR